MIVAASAAQIGGRLAGPDDVLKINTKIIDGVERWVLEAKAGSGGTINIGARCMARRQPSWRNRRAYSASRSISTRASVAHAAAGSPSRLETVAARARVRGLRVHGGQTLASQAPPVWSGNS